MHKNAFPLLERYEQAERFFWSNISLEVGQLNGTEVYASGVNNIYLNSAIQRKPITEANFYNTLNDIQAFYEAHNIPWVWIIRENLILPTLITKHSLQVFDKSTMMYCDLSKPLPYRENIELQILENNKDLTDWGFCLSKAYNSPNETAAQYEDAIKQYIVAHKRKTWDKTRFHHFVAYLNEIPVSCLTLTLQQGAARFDDVGTIPEQQNKGFATQLILYCMKRAKSFGADICFLESSQVGINMYQKLGFNSLLSNLYFKV